MKMRFNSSNGSHAGPIVLPIVCFLQPSPGLEIGSFAVVWAIQTEDVCVILGFDQFIFDPDTRYNFVNINLNCCKSVSDNFWKLTLMLL